MPALNFQSRFAPLILAGTKTTTIRLPRKDGRDPKPGDRLYLYTGMRTKACRKLGEARCLTRRSIRLEASGACAIDRVWMVDSDEDDRLARDDGFDTFGELLDCIEKMHGLPFDGWLYRWGDLKLEAR